MRERMRFLSIMLISIYVMGLTHVGWTTAFAQGSAGESIFLGETGDVYITGSGSLGEGVEVGFPAGSDGVSVAPAEGSPGVSVAAGHAGVGVEPRPAPPPPPDKKEGFTPLQIGAALGAAALLGWGIAELASSDSKDDAKDAKKAAEEAAAAAAGTQAAIAAMAQDQAAASAGAADAAAAAATAAAAEAQAAAAAANPQFRTVILLAGTFASGHTFTCGNNPSITFSVPPAFAQVGDNQGRVVTLDLGEVTAYEASDCSGNNFGGSYQQIGNNQVLIRVDDGFYAGYTRIANEGTIVLQNGAVLRAQGNGGAKIVRYPL